VATAPTRPCFIPTRRQTAASSRFTTMVANSFRTRRSTQFFSAVLPRSPLRTGPSIASPKRGRRRPQITWGIPSRSGTVRRRSSIRATRTTLFFLTIPATRSMVVVLLATTVISAAMARTFSTPVLAMIISTAAMASIFCSRRSQFNSAQQNDAGRRQRR